jgi:subtilisin family serine protease
MRTISMAATGRRSSTALRAIPLTLAAAALVALSAALPAAAQDASARFKALNSSQPLKGARMPLSMLNKERVSVVVLMSTPSVAEARAARIDHRISEQEHATIHAQIAREHNGIEGAIASRGGKILSHFADAMNGIKVQIDRGEIAGLKSLPGVVDVVPVLTHQLSNVVSVPYIGAPQVWQGAPGLRGEHVKIAIIDTGIDYTHANFGGPGTPAAFAAAAATSTQPADPALFGPNAPKVKGGIDLAGDAYNANDPASVPMPDPNPLDCNGHGSHVAGTAAGFGIANDGTTYQGPYNAGVYAGGFAIGPGVAPLADLYAVRVFGCAGSSNLVSDGIDWAVHHGMDVINMSLGAPFGTANTSDAIATNNAAAAGITVVAAAGNSGPGNYIVSTPGSADGAISAAATDAHASFPGTNLMLNTGPTILAQDSNGAPFPSSLPIVVLRNPDGSVSLGCNDAEYVDALITGKLVVTARGICARIQRAQSGQAHGAAAVAMINNGPGYPPFENTIAGVTIPFFGVLRANGAALAGAASSSMTAGIVLNPGFAIAAGFSSGGVRSGDSVLKPDITAPGVAVISTLVGSGNGSGTDSGTSMATPHVTGVSALVRQAHPDWTSDAIREAVIESASPTALKDYALRTEGAGLVQAVGATSTQVVARGNGHNPRLSFGFAEFTSNYSDSRQLILENHGSTTASFSIGSTQVGGVPHTASLNHSTVTIAPHDTAEVKLSLTVPSATVGSTHDAFGNDAYEEVAGRVTLTPAAGSNSGVSLNLPYYLVPRARSTVMAAAVGGSVPVVHLSNPSGAIAGNGDFYAWGLSSPAAGVISAAFDPRAIGVQSNPISAADSILVFAVNTKARFSTVAPGEYDIYLDVNGDGVADYVVFVADYGAVTAGSNSGQAASFVLNLKTGALRAEFFADAPTDGSTVLIPVLASTLGLSPANPRFAYVVNAFDDTGAGERVPGVGTFNVFTPAVSNAMFVPVAPRTAVNVPYAIDPVEAKLTPALGLMVVTEDNLSGTTQANLIPLAVH